MQFYVAEYQADTMHLTAEEHGAYLLLIFNYWQTGKPIPEKRLQKIARVSSERWTDVKETLSEFFRDNGDEWVHDRIEADLIAARDSQAQRAAAGKASAEARKAAKRDALKKESNDRSTTVEQPKDERSTNKEENRTEENREQNNGSADADPAGEPSPSKKFTDEDFEKFWKFCREHWFGAHGHKADAKKEFFKLRPEKDDLHEILKLTRQECEYRRRVEAAEGFCENMKHVGRWIKVRGWEDVRERIESGPSLSVVQSGSKRSKVRRQKILPGSNPMLLDGEWIEDGYICQEIAS
jgi:uncharacterized protein YdaU (DUF1376 family)